jgi:glycosyltransferase involved in cell wall biosynthesis
VLLADDPQDFADKVVRLLTDQQVAQQLGANGLTRVQAQYSWGAMGKVLESAIQTIMISRNGRATK